MNRFNIALVTLTLLCLFIHFTAASLHTTDAKADVKVNHLILPHYSETLTPPEMAPETTTGKMAHTRATTTGRTTMSIGSTIKAHPLH